MKTKFIRKIITILFILYILLQTTSFTFAETISSKTVSQESGGDKLINNISAMNLNRENIKKFVDDYFQTNMIKWKVPGAAVSVVEGNEELYKAGYGVSDIETKKPVNPDRTTFPAASISKLFTATAIMQLYQEGKLDLNENIQTYLNDIVIKNPYNEPVTCQNLLTHSSGLDEQSELDGGTLNKNSIKSQKQYFTKHVPRVILKPNTTCRYSNIGYNLLGYIVEKVSGKPYEDYITDNILNQLSMQHSSVRIENELMACGYEFIDDKYQKVPFAYQYTSGSSGIISTVTDMENFMIMHLNNGKYKNKYILDADTEQKMLNKQFSNNDIFDGMGEGFIRASRNGVQLLKHEGALPGYTATMLLIPSRRFGVYIATNSLGGMVFDFEEAFLDHFFGKGTIGADNNKNLFDAGKYVGTYRSYDGISERNISKIFAALDDTNQLKVTKLSNTKLSVSYYEMSKERVETGLVYKSDGIFTREDGKGYITFRENSSGITEYAFNDISHQAYKKIGYVETMPLIIIILLILLIVLFVGTIIILFRKVRKKQAEHRLLWRVISIVNIMYIFGFLGVVGLEGYMIINYEYRLMSIIYLLLTFLMIAVALNICEIIRFVYGIWKKIFNTRTAIKVTAALTLQILFMVLMVYFNMVGYHVY